MECERIFFAMNELRAFCPGVGQRKTDPELLNHSVAAFHARNKAWSEATSFKSASRLKCGTVRADQGGASVIPVREMT
jgi:hypothetical protein